MRQINHWSIILTASIIALVVGCSYAVKHFLHPTNNLEAARLEMKEAIKAIDKNHFDAAREHCLKARNTSGPDTPLNKLFDSSVNSFELEAVKSMLDPSQPMYLALRGLMSSDTGASEQAVEDYSKAIVAIESHAEALQNFDTRLQLAGLYNARSQEFAQLHNFPKAFTDAEHAVELDQLFSSAHESEAKACVPLNKPSLGKEHLALKRALEAFGVRTRFSNALRFGDPDERPRVGFVHDLSTDSFGLTEIENAAASLDHSGDLKLFKPREKAITRESKLVLAEGTTPANFPKLSELKNSDVVIARCMRDEHGVDVILSGQKIKNW